MAEQTLSELVMNLIDWIQSLHEKNLKYKAHVETLSNDLAKAQNLTRELEAKLSSYQGTTISIAEPQPQYIETYPATHIEPQPRLIEFYQTNTNEPQPPYIEPYPTIINHEQPRFIEFYPTNTGDQQPQFMQL